MNSIDRIENKMKGSLWGQAIGNALGILSEFLTKEDLKNKFPNGINFYSENIGIWEDDDTNQMLCILDELIEHKDINPQSLAKRFKNWLETDGRGCGNLVYQVIKHPLFIENPSTAAYDIWANSNFQNAPNGAVMRTSVIGLLQDNWLKAAEKAAKVTHADPRSIGSAVIVTAIIHNLIWENREMTYTEIIELARKYDERIEEWIYKAYYGNLENMELDEPSSIGYTLKTLGAALWCYFHSQDFEQGLIAIVNEAGDADTNAAVACALLGAKFGIDQIPDKWINNLINKEKYQNKITEALKTFLF